MSLRAWGIRSRSANTWQQARIGSAHAGGAGPRDPQKVRSWLIAERGIVITYAEVQRAPFELHAPLLRVSPHVDSATEDLEAFAEALAEATELLS